MDVEINSLSLRSLEVDALVTISTEVRVPPSYRDREHSSTVANIIQLTPPSEAVQSGGDQRAVDLLPAEAVDHGVVSHPDDQNPIV